MDLKMKNIIPRLSFRKIMIFLDILLVIIFLISFSFVGSFVKDNVYEVISIEDSVMVDKAMMNSLMVNLNIEKFKAIIQNIENKTIPREIKNFKNIFK